MHTQLLKLSKIEKRITTRILDLLRKVNDSRLYLDWGYASLYDYMIRGLGYSESVAYQRQSAIRVIKEVPEVKQQLESGSLNFSTLTKAYKTLKDKPTSQKRKILEQIQNKSVREVEKILAPDCDSDVSKKRYIGSETLRLTMDVSESEYNEIQRLRALKSQPNDKQLFVSLVRNALKAFEVVRKTTSTKPRQIAQSLKNTLLKKANYKCQYPGCNQDHYLHIDHIRPVREGGSNHITNLQVLCASHNLRKG